MVPGLVFTSRTGEFAFSADGAGHEWTARLPLGVLTTPNTLWEHNPVTCPTCAEFPRPYGVVEAEKMRDA
jgi:hypothetical protein